MLKIIKLFNRPIFGKNNNGKLVFKKNDGNIKVVKFSVGNNMKSAKKLKKIKKLKIV